MNSKQSLVGYFDVDDTLTRSVGTKVIPVPAVIEHVRDLARADATLYCWSTAGADYARDTARSLGIEDCFSGFLPKPNVLIDDQDPTSWQRFAVVHPLNVSSKSLDEYWSLTRSSVQVLG